MIYDISHRTIFGYSQSVAISQHLLHLVPRSCPHQTCRHHALIVEPPPTVMREAVDFFGNSMTYLTVEESHDELAIVAKSVIEVVAPHTPAPAMTMSWDALASDILHARDADSLDALQFVFDSPFAVQHDDVTAYARSSFPPGRPVLEAAVELMGRINAEFRYEGGVTDIYTPVQRVLAEQRGVCQDFAHLQIACLRGMGLPARYVSGYLLTRPPEGRERLVGADASHAWVSVWVPGHGWVGLDPTNNTLPADEHIIVAWGRDYGDVSPITGMVIGGGEQSLKVEVDVAPVVR